MEHVKALECTVCGDTYRHDSGIYTCPKEPGIAGILEVIYDYDIVIDRFDEDLDGAIASQAKYRAFLPVPYDAELVTLGEGGTSLLDAPNLSVELGADVRVKDDGRNPTGVLKDRATSVAVSRAVAEGRKVVTCASTGNAAASLAGYAARADLHARIFVPDDAPKEKLAQPLVYGADVLAVDGDYDQAYDTSLEATEKFGWYNRNAAINPFQVEGKRTVGHELAEQCRESPPDWVVFSMGDGCTIYGGWKGYKEFFDLGFVDHTPKMLGVQAEKACAIHDAFHSHEGAGDVAQTVADSIAVGRPRNTLKACRALEESGGTSVTVTDEEILDAEGLLGRTEGIYAEPAGAAPVAGVKKARDEGVIEEDESVVVVVTGNGLKDTESALEAAAEPTSISPNISDVVDIYGEEMVDGE